MSLVKLQLVEGELARAESAESKMETYEMLLMECQDTLQITKDEMSTEMVRGEREMGMSQMKQGGHLAFYVVQLYIIMRWPQSFSVGISPS